MRSELLGRGTSRGLVQCAVDDLGRAAHGRIRYEWIECQDDRTGPTARTLSAGAEGAIVRLESGHRAVNVASVTFSRQAHLDADITHLFPPSIAAQVTSGHHVATPTKSRLLKIASELPLLPACDPNLVTMRQDGVGNLAAGTTYLTLDLGTSGHGCLMASHTLILWAGTTPQRIATLEVTGPTTVAIAVRPAHERVMHLEAPLGAA